MSTALLQLATGVFLGLPLLFIFIINLVKRDVGQKIALPVAACAGLLQMAASIYCYFAIWMNRKDFIEFSLLWDISSQEGAAFFSLDFFSLIVLFSIGMVALAAAITAKGHIGGKELNFSSVLMTLMLGMNGISLVRDLFSLYVFLEITAISSFILIALYKDKRGLEGSFKYLYMSAIATAFMLTGMAFLFMSVGSLGFAELAAGINANLEGAEGLFLGIAIIFLVSGIAIKAGLAPFHGWLPDVYQAAPAPVSVLMGGIVTKVAGVYAIIRIAYHVLPDIEIFRYALGVFALFSIIFGAVLAVNQKNFKRLLAYSSISQIGYIVLGAASGHPLGFIGAILHFFNHATFKTTLFVNAATLEKQAGSVDLDELGGGLAKQMPITGISSVLALLSTAGIPPLAGFWSKLLIILAVWQSGHNWLAGIALFATVFTMVYFLYLQRKVFFGLPEEKNKDIRDAKGAKAWVVVGLSAITVGVGILFPFVLRFLQSQGLL